MPKKKTNEEFIKDVYDLVGDEYEVIEPYKKALIKIKFKHSVCENVFDMRPSSFLEGQRCPKCARKKTDKEFKSEVYALVNDEYIFLEKYEGANINIVCRHNECGHEWSVRPNGFLLQGNRCPQCDVKNRTKTNEQFLRDVYYLVNDEYTFLEEYKNNQKNILCRHNECGCEWDVSPSKFLFDNNRCPLCSQEKRGRVKKTQEEFEKQIYDLVGNEYKVIGDYNGTHTKILMEHTVHNHQWYVEPNSFLLGTRCPKCIMSKGEQSIAEHLQDNNIEYIQEYRFKDCKSETKYTLPFDFYLPDYNLLIEYDGEQHYRPVDFAGYGEKWANERFELQQQNDKIKTTYCISNKIPLLRIPYWDFDNIEEILSKKLSELEVKCA